MVDTSYNVWLIEVNSSPSMEYSSPITQRMVKEGLSNISDIVTEQEKHIGKDDHETTNFAQSIGQKIGGFELIFNS